MKEKLQNVTCKKKNVLKELCNKEKSRKFAPLCLKFTIRDDVYESFQACFHRAWRLVGQ